MLAERIIVGYNWNGPRSHLAPWIFWVPKKFGPCEIWILRNLVPEWKSLYGISMQGPTFLGPKFQEPKISEVKMRSGLFLWLPGFKKYGRCFWIIWPSQKNIKYIPCGCLLCIMCTKGYDDFCLPVSLKINKRHFYCFTNYQSRISILTNFSSNQNECFMFAWWPFLSKLSNWIENLWFVKPCSRLDLLD